MNNINNNPMVENVLHVRTTTYLVLIEVLKYEDCKNV